MHLIHPEHPSTEPIPRSGKSHSDPQVVYFLNGAPSNECFSSVEYPTGTSDCSRALRLENSALTQFLIYADDDGADRVDSIASS